MNAENFYLKYGPGCHANPGNIDQAVMQNPGNNHLEY
jgi:hypothetical protein